MIEPTREDLTERPNLRARVSRQYLMEEFMTSTTIRAARPSFPLSLLAGGLVASIVMGMWQMILEAIIPGGAGFWSPLVFIAATILRDLQTVSVPVPFHLLGVLLGLIGHMMNAVIFGLLFTYLIAPRAKSLIG